ncbi:MAG: FMN-binding protein [Solirubrobacteraceae bacterium]
MIAAKTLRLIRRLAGTAALTAVVAVLVVIYLRSEGNGTGALAPLPRASANRGTGGERGSSSNGSSGSQGGSGSTGSDSCEPPRVCSSQGSGAGGSRSSGGSSATATYTGPVAETPYGPVQVAVAEERGKLVDVKALQLPTEHALSQEISEQVAPMLRSEALQAQSAEINLVSGATYTSEGYASSLQAALRQAG